MPHFALHVQGVFPASLFSEQVHMRSTLVTTGHQIPMSTSEQSMDVWKEVFPARLGVRTCSSVIECEFM